MRPSSSSATAAGLGGDGEARGRDAAAAHEFDGVAALVADGDRVAEPPRRRGAAGRRACRAGRGRRAARTASSRSAISAGTKKTPRGGREVARPGGQRPRASRTRPVAPSSSASSAGRRRPTPSVPLAGVEGQALRARRRAPACGPRSARRSAGRRARRARRAVRSAAGCRAARRPAAARWTLSEPQPARQERGEHSRATGHRVSMPSAVMTKRESLSCVAAGAAVALAVIAVGVAVHAAGGQLGTASPPFVMALGATGGCRLDLAGRGRGARRADGGRRRACWRFRARRSGFAASAFAAALGVAPGGQRRPCRHRGWDGVFDLGPGRQLRGQERGPRRACPRSPTARTSSSTASPSSCPASRSASPGIRPACPC